MEGKIQGGAKMDAYFSSALLLLVASADDADAAAVVVFSAIVAVRRVVHSEATPCALGHVGWGVAGAGDTEKNR